MPELTELAGVVLAAGRGRRLAPLTDGFAKPVVRFAGRPLVVWALDALARAGVETIGVNAWHRAEQVEAVVEHWRERRAARAGLEPRVILVEEVDLLGTGGGARGVWEALGRPPGPVVVLNGDIVTDVDLRPHLGAHRAPMGDGQSPAATLLVNDGGEGRVLLAADGRRVVGLPGYDGPVVAGVPAREVSFVGASILSAEALLELPLGPGCLLRDGLVERLLGEGRVAASTSTDRHVDVGTPERWWNAVNDALDGRW